MQIRSLTNDELNLEKCKEIMKIKIFLSNSLEANIQKPV